MVRKFAGPLGTLIPRGPFRFGGAQLLNDKYHNLPVSLFRAFSHAEV
jgi:hypothetical protein